MKRRIFVSSSFGLCIGWSLFALAGIAAKSYASAMRSHRVLDLDMFDVNRQRLVPSRLYMPDGASPEQPVPLIVFSHGLGGSRKGYSYLGRHWADEGIASLHPQHVGSDNALWQGNPFELLSRLRSAVRDSEVLARVHDLRFALDQVLESEQGPSIDVSKIGVAGHSYGANTAMLISGAKVITVNQKMVVERDPRMQSALLISAPPLVAQGPMEDVLGSISIPTLHVTSLEDTISLPGYQSTVKDRIAIFDAMGASPKTLAVFNVGGHSIFTDRITGSGPETSFRIKNATKELSTIFFKQTLKHRAANLGLYSPIAQPFYGKNAGLPPSKLEENHGMEQWLLKHQYLLDRFVKHETDKRSFPSRSKIQ